MWLTIGEADSEPLRETVEARNAQRTAPAASSVMQARLGLMLDGQSVLSCEISILVYTC